MATDWEIEQTAKDGGAADHALVEAASKAAGLVHPLTAMMALGDAEKIVALVRAQREAVRELASAVAQWQEADEAAQRLFPELRDAA